MIGLVKTQALKRLAHLLNVLTAIGQYFLVLCSGQVRPRLDAVDRQSLAPFFAFSRLLLRLARLKEWPTVVC